MFSNDGTRRSESTQDKISMSFVLENLKPVRIRNIFSQIQVFHFSWLRKGKPAPFYTFADDASFVEFLDDALNRGFCNSASQNWSYECVRIVVETGSHLAKKASVQSHNSIPDERSRKIIV